MQEKKSQPVLVTMSALAGLQVLVGGSALADVVGTKVAALASLVLAAVTVGMAFYIRGQVVPYEDVTQYRSSDNHIVDGPAVDFTEQSH